MPNNELIASAPTVGKIEKLINEYFFSENYRVAENDSTKTLNVFNQKTGKCLDGYLVRYSRGRYRFERSV